MSDQEQKPEESRSGLTPDIVDRLRGMSPEPFKKKKPKVPKKTAELSPTSALEPKKPEAKKLLSERLSNAHVAAFCFTLVQEACDMLNIPMNRHLLTHGLRANMEGKSPEVETEDVEVEGEILYRRDLYALWDYGFWRQPEVTFEQWLADRRKLKSSAFEMSKILGKEDFGKTHEEWAAFLPHWDPTGLPINYTQKQALAWLDSQRSESEGDKKKYLLVCSRNSFKSTNVRILALCLLVTCPDAITLIISETNRLSKKGMKEMRGYLERIPKNPSLFQQYFGEYTQEQTEGSSGTYDNPLAHLGLPQSALEQSSMESANTGSRFWLCIFDDPISRDNGTANDEQKAAALSKFGSIMRLREPAGFSINVQTPWTAGDLGATMISQNADDPEHPLAVRIDPVMNILPSAARKPLLDLKEEDVDLNFLPKLNWRFVRDELRSPEGIAFFKSQYLCQWPSSEEEGLTIIFEEDDLRNHTRPLSLFQSSPGWAAGQSVMSCDRAFSTSQYADFSVITAARIMHWENRLICLFTDVRLGRWKESEISKNICEMVEKWRPTNMVIERDRGWEDFNLSIRRTALARETPLPHIYWKAIVGGADGADGKARRIKLMEAPLTEHKIFFVSAQWNDEIFPQFVHFKGLVKRSTSHKKDDAPDACSLLWDTYMPRDIKEIDPKEMEMRKKDEEAERNKERLRQGHAMMFDHSQGTTRKEIMSILPKGMQPSVPEDERPPTSVAGSFARQTGHGGWANIGSLRGGPKKPKD